MPCLKRSLLSNKISLLYRKYCYGRVCCLQRCIKNIRWSIIIKLGRWIDREIPIRLGPMYPVYGGWLTDEESDAWHAKAKLIYERWKAGAPKLTFRKKLYRQVYKYCVRIIEPT